MNSAVGAEDGIAQYYFDGDLIMEVTDFAFSDNGSQTSPRLNWNYVAFGGNSYNHYAPLSQAAEQWYAVDDIVISTTRVGCSPTDSQVPEAPTLRIKNVVP